jgi:hypothetical protein
MTPTGLAKYLLRRFYMKNISSLLIGCVIFATASGNSQTSQRPPMAGTNQNMAAPNGAVVSPAPGAPVASGRVSAPPMSVGAMPNTHPMVSTAGTISPGGSQTVVVPATGMSTPNQPYTNNGINGNYGRLGPNGFGAPGTNGFGTPGTNGFGVPGTNGFGTPGTNGFGAPGTNGFGVPRTNGFYQGPRSGNYLNTTTNGFGSPVNQ